MLLHEHAASLCSLLPFFVSFSSKTHLAQMQFLISQGLVFVFVSCFLFLASLWMKKEMTWQRQLGLKEQNILKCWSGGEGKQNSMSVEKIGFNKQ